MIRYEPNPQFGGETFDIILNRMMERIKERDRREGALIWDSNASSAIELQEIYIALDDILVEAWGDSASREFLIRRARERNIIPFPATHAVLRGIFKPSPTATDVDLTGRRFSMPNTTLTYTVERVAEDEQGGWEVRCEQLGSEGNHFFGSVTPLWGGNPRVQSAELVELLIPAQNEESTESIRQRYFDSFNEKAFGGNIRDYQVNVRAIEGVGAVKVTPIWQGGGTVLLTILDYLYNPASGALIDRVQEVIDPVSRADEHAPSSSVLGGFSQSEKNFLLRKPHMGLGLAPIGHQVTVRTADIMSVDISTQLTFLGGFTWGMVQPQVTSMLEAYMLELRQDWENQDILTPMGLFQNPLIVMISQINARILTIQGITDIQNTMINGVAANLEIEKYSIPMLGVISV